MENYTFLSPKKNKGPGGGKMTDIRIIEVSGSSYEMGQQYGEFCRKLVQGFINAHYKTLLYYSAEKARTFLQEHDVRKLARQYIPFAGGGSIL